MPVWREKLGTALAGAAKPQVITAAANNTPKLMNPDILNDETKFVLIRPPFFLLKPCIETPKISPQVPSEPQRHSKE
jgi:hypothetical protein